MLTVFETLDNNCARGFALALLSLKVRFQFEALIFTGRQMFWRFKDVSGILAVTI